VLVPGVEVDVLADGALDLPASVLTGVDYVLAAAHAHLDLPRAAQTARLVRAMESGLVDALAHPSGRLLGVRDGIDVDVEELARTAARTDVALELNVHPSRHDLGDVHAFMAREARAWIVIGTDAHDADAVGAWGSGIDGARRAWLEAKDVLNTRPLVDFLGLVRARRRESLA
jgi:DNA polymerase (family 10)